VLLCLPLLLAVLDRLVEPVAGTLENPYWLVLALCLALLHFEVQANALEGPPGYVETIPQYLQSDDLHGTRERGKPGY
jgi:hypothetical protein